MSRSDQGRTCALAITIALAVSGCGSRARLRLVDGSVDGQIEAADADAIALADGRRIRRDRIVDIDHPGNVAATIGGLLVLSGGALAASNYGDCTPGTNDNFRCLGQKMGFVSGIGIAEVGAALFLYGLVRWTASRSASRPAKHSVAVFMPAGGGAVGGLQVAF